jgi:ankyrin repeat protein
MDQLFNHLWCGSEDTTQPFSAEIETNQQTRRRHLIEHHCIASEGGHMDLAQLPVEYDADATAQRKDRATPLHRASEGGHVDLVQLIEHGFNAAAQDKYGTAPLHWASSQGDVHLSRSLIHVLESIPHGISPKDKNR